MTVIDRAIAFCAYLDPDFPRRLEGSTPEQIAELSRVMEREPSPLHRAFLERMGGSLGPLSLGLYATRPAELIARKSHVLEGIPEGITLFAVPLADDDEDIFLLDGEDPEVVAHDGVPFDDQGRLDPARAEPVAGSLSELLCLPFLNARIAVRKCLQASYTEKEMRPDTLARCRRIAEGRRPAHDQLAGRGRGETAPHPGHHAQRAHPRRLRHLARGGVGPDGGADRRPAGARGGARTADDRAGGRPARAGCSISLPVMRLRPMRLARNAEPALREARSYWLRCSMTTTPWPLGVQTPSSPAGLAPAFQEPPPPPTRPPPPE